MERVAIEIEPFRPYLSKILRNTVEAPNCGKFSYDNFKYF
jgi:hypothetical protein